MTGLDSVYHRRTRRVRYASMTHRLIRTLIPVVVACLVFTLPLQAGTIVAGKPEDLGFSPERLARIHEAVQRHIDAKSLAGAVTMVVRNGRIAHLEGHGVIDLETNRPMPKDAIFRCRGSFPSSRT